MGYENREDSQQMDFRNDPKARCLPLSETPTISFRVSQEMLVAIDDWAARQSGHPERSTAIRRLLESALAAERKK